MSGFLRLRPEAIFYIAAKGSHIEVRRGLAGEIQLDVAAHGLTINLRIGGRCQCCGNGAGDSPEASPGHSPQGQVRVAADGIGFDIGIAAGQHDAAADRLRLDPLCRHRREVNIAAHIVRAQVATAVAADIAADRAQLQSAVNCRNLQVGAHQRGGNRTVRGHVNHQVRFAVAHAKVHAPRQHHADGGAVAVARHIDALHIFADRAGHSDLGFVPSLHID